MYTFIQNRRVDPGKYIYTKIGVLLAKLGAHKHWWWLLLKGLPVLTTFHPAPRCVPTWLTPIPDRSMEVFTLSWKEELEAEAGAAQPVRQVVAAVSQVPQQLL